MHELEAVSATLEDEGIRAHAPGRSVAGRFPGTGEAIFQVPLRVAADRADEARARIDPFLKAEPKAVDFPDGVDFPRGRDAAGERGRASGERGRFGPGRILLIAPSIAAVRWMLTRGGGSGPGSSKRTRGPSPLIAAPPR